MRTIEELSIFFRYAIGRLSMKVFSFARFNWTQLNAAAKTMRAAKEDQAEEKKPLRLTVSRSWEKETLVHCAAAAAAAVTSLCQPPPKRAGTTLLSVCVDLIYGRLAPATVQGCSPFQINVSRASTMARLKHTHTISSSSHRFSSRTETGKTLRLHG